MCSFGRKYDHAQDSPQVTNFTSELLISPHILTRSCRSAYIIAINAIGTAYINNIAYAYNRAVKINESTKKIKTKEILWKKIIVMLDTI